MLLCRVSMLAERIMLQLRVIHRPNAMALTLSTELIRFIESGVSLGAASRDRRCVPSLSRVLACRVDRAQGNLRLWLARSQSEQLLRDAFDCNQIALVLSDPRTHRTWQIKGDSVQQCQVASDDLIWIQQHIEDFSAVIGPLGFSPAFATALYDHHPDDLAAIRFTPRELFDQTPGPRAGEKVAGSP